MDIMGGSTSASPCSSFNPSPASSSFPSPVSSTLPPTINGNSLIPWLKNLSSASSSSLSSSKFMHNYMHSGSISAPVTPPLSSPTSRTPRFKNVPDGSFAHPHWGQFLPLSSPPSPDRGIFPEYGGSRIPQSGPTSPTFSLVNWNQFDFTVEDLARGGSLTCTPGQSGTCSPAVVAASGHVADIPMAEVMKHEFAFGSNAGGVVKPWEGERIHEECGSDDLELTLGLKNQMN